MTQRQADIAAEAVIGSGVENGIPKGGDKRRRNKDIAKARNIELLRMRIEGKAIDDIARHFNIKPSTASRVISETLAGAVNMRAEELREIENARLDVAQAAIWPKVKKGNMDAIDSFIRLSARRSRMNGLDAPQKVQVGGNVRLEMEEALLQLERLLEAPDDPDIVDAEVVEGAD